MDEAERLAKLRGFGLSEYASRAYLALLELGTTEARDVSRLAKVPLAKVYSTLDQLQERGLVFVEPGPPKQFTPAPFQAFLHRRRERLGAELRQLEVVEKEMVELFPLRGNASADDRGAFFTVRGRESVLEKLASLTRAAKDDVLFLTADNFSLRAHVPALLAEAAERGVGLRALVAVDIDRRRALEQMAAHAELRVKEPRDGRPTDVAIAVFDSRQLMIIHFVPDDSSRYDGKDVAIVASEAAIVRAVRSILETQWEAAESFERAMARLAAGLPRATTTIFDDRKELVEAWTASMRAARTTHDILGTLAASELREEVLAGFRGASQAGVRQRAIFLIDDERAGARLKEALGPSGELRRLASANITRVSILDGREIYFGPARPAPAPSASEELTVRSNDPAAVRVLSAYFDAVWDASVPF